LNYQVVYDASQTGIDWLPIFIATVVLTAAIIGWRGRHRPYIRGEPWIAGIILIFAVMMAPCLIIGKINEYITAQTRLRTNQMEVVEGRIENFSPGLNPKAVERFTVKDVSFSYSEQVSTPGFHRTTYWGGPMKAGLQVRIHYTDIFGETVHPTILRLEIAK
jgi:hypothetical protein